jgi:hypothetical protein
VAGGAWIFVSHSHRDLERVRRVRDALEQRGHNPLLFFLRSLDDESELDALIRREIHARRRDLEMAKRIRDALTAREHTVWIDYQDIDPAGAWVDSINAGIERAVDHRRDPPSAQSRCPAQRDDHARDRACGAVRRERASRRDDRARARGGRPRRRGRCWPAPRSPTARAAASTSRPGPSRTAWPISCLAMHSAGLGSAIDR